MQVNEDLCLLIKIRTGLNLIELESAMTFIQHLTDQRRAGLACLTVYAAGLMLAGCGSAIPLTADEVAPARDYLIGPGDTVNIQVWRSPDVSMSVSVRPDGKITTPLVEDLQASGRTATQLARDIETALSKYIQQPVVTVIVTSFVGLYTEQIRVIGAATRPQSLAYRNGMSLMDVLIAVGGVTDFAAGNKASIIRTRDGQQQKLRVRLDDLLKDGDIGANVGMRPGDVLVIPESFF
jgi:polysaccharide export outer membrane protein